MHCRAYVGHQRAEFRFRCFGAKKVAARFSKHLNAP
jgi:hypothetical protein